MFENRYLRKDGGYSWLSWNAMTVPQEGVFIAVARDMTEYKETVELLRQSEKMEAIGQLAGGIAHDFNNQLAGIMGCAEMIEGASPAGSVAAKNARLILNAAGNSAELTKKLLAFARKGKYRSVGIDLNEAAREAVSLIERTIDKKVGIRLDLRSSAPFATGDPAQVQNALMNLCVNARDAMPGGGRLLVATRDEELGEEAAGRLGAEPGSYVAVDVKDTGEGLTEEARAHLFEPFFTTKPEGKGTGLGLAAVYGIMKSHHGAVRASSEKGKGTVFTLLFPRVAASAGEGGSAPGEAARAKGGRVLVVDDEEIIRTMACALLETGGYKAESAASGQDALDALAAKGCPDAIILDLSMPGMDGAEAFRLIRAAHPGARIIISSGYSMNDSVQTLMEGGAAIFVQKPYRKAELLAAVERAIGDRP
jgi:signal transduction histidine kinase/CheY-like chemotaxis protein